MFLLVVLEIWFLDVFGLVILLFVLLDLGIFFEICIFGLKNLFIGLLFGVLLELFKDVVIFELSDLKRGFVECWFWLNIDGFVKVLLMEVVVFLVLFIDFLLLLLVGKLLVV